MKQRAYGFTIVELLIVIVVVAILAALSYVGYTNISQRANNAATINVASSSLRLMKAYVAQTGAYPLTHESDEIMSCITGESGCRGSGGNVINVRPEFRASVNGVGSLPQTAPSDSARSGVIYFYRPNAITYNGESQSSWLVYWLHGTNQDCGLPGVLSYSVPFTASAVGYSNGGESGKTRCNVLIPGPAHV